VPFRAVDGGCRRGASRRRPIGGKDAGLLLLVRHSLPLHEAVQESDLQLEIGEVLVEIRVLHIGFDARHLSAMRRSSERCSVMSTRISSPS
jgi:hypothetical protein